jgi:putative ABC transport system permease protein
MLLTDLKMALRGLIRSRTYTAISLFGLICATTCAVLVLGRAIDEHRYATYYPDGDRTYQVVRVRITDDGTKADDWVPGGIAKGLWETHPDVQAARADASIWSKTWIRADEMSQEMFFARVDSQFFDIFGINVIKGRASKEPHTAVLSEDAATRLFGDVDPIGRVVTRPGDGHDDVGDYRVTGLIADLPKYAFHKLDVVTSWPTAHRTANDRRTWEGWQNSLFGPKCFVKLPVGYDPARIEAAIDDLMRASVEPQFAKGVTFHLQPMSRAYTHWLYEYGNPGESPAEHTASLALITLIVVLVAAANFVSLATARASTREPEIRTRRAIGAGRIGIFRQFLIESACLSGIALAIGFAVALYAPLPEIFGETVSVGNLAEPLMLLGLFGIFGCVTLFAGAYPAVLATRISPSGSNRLSLSRGQFSVRNGLIIAQMACTVFFIVGASVIYNQTEMMRNADLGYDSSHLFTTRSLLVSNAGRHRDTLRDALRRLPDVISATTIWPGPGAPEQPRRITYLPADPDNRFDMQVVGIDHYFLETYGTNLISGQNVGPGMDRRREGRFLINETAVGKLGFIDVQRALGQELVVGDRRGPIIGVIEDFHSESLHGAIEPTVFYNWARTAVTLRVANSDVESTLTGAKRIWEQMLGEPVSFRAVDAFYEWTYRDQVRRSESFSIMAGTAILLAALGVFGMASYETERRGKEVAVRKVLGATIPDIVTLFWRQHAVLIVIANLIAWPIAYSLMRDWLTDFAYRIELTAVPFFISAGLTGALFLLVVGSQALRIGRADPVKTINQNA